MSLSRWRPMTPNLHPSIGCWRSLNSFKVHLGETGLGQGPWLYVRKNNNNKRTSYKENQKWKRLPNVFHCSGVLERGGVEALAHRVSCCQSHSKGQKQCGEVLSTLLFPFRMAPKARERDSLQGELWSLAKHRILPPFWDATVSLLIPYFENNGHVQLFFPKWNWKNRKGRTRIMPIAFLYTFEKTGMDDCAGKPNSVNWEETAA